MNWADAEKLFARVARTQTAEFRDENGHVIATTVPPAGPAPDWVAAVTPEDVLGVYDRIDEAALRVEILYAGPARRRYQLGMEVTHTWPGNGIGLQ